MKLFFNKRVGVLLVLSIATVLSILGFWRYYYLWNPAYPYEKELRNLYLSNRGTFKQLQLMAFEDSSQVYRLSKDDIRTSGLPAARQEEYSKLLSSLPTGTTIWINGTHLVKFLFEHGGSSLITGPDWSNGIDYILDESRKDGQVVRNSGEIDLKQENTYLIPLEDHWYIFHEQN